MKILLLGASGQTGREFATSAIAQGHRVRALVRRVPAGDMALSDWRLGDASSAEALRDAVADQDAVVSCLGQRSSADAGILGANARALVSALAGSSTRLLVISQGLLSPSANPLVLLLRLVLRRHVRDSREMEAAIGAWDGDWTIVRPPRLTNGVETAWVSAVDRQPANSSMSRKTLAAFLLDALEAPQFYRKVVGVGAR